MNARSAGSGTSAGNHVPGEIRVVSEFGGGSDTAGIEVFKRVGSGGSEHQRTADQDCSSDTAKCQPGGRFAQKRE